MKRVHAGCCLAVWAGLVLGLGPSGADETGTPVGLSPRAVEAIQLLSSRDPYQRQTGFLRLEALREPATIGTITTYLRSQDPDMRAWSVRALAAIQGAAAAPELLAILRDDRHPDVRRAVLLGLEPHQANDPAILPAFLTALHDRHPEVRMTAVDIVSRINEPRAREAILLRNKRESNRNVRRVLSLAMKRIGM